MQSSMAERVPMGVGLAVGMGVTTALGWWAWKTYHGRTFKWEEVGVLDQLVIYPLKLARGITVTSATAKRHGLAKDLLQDRSFMVVREDGSFVSGRHAGNLMTVSVTFETHDLILRARDDSQIRVDLHAVVKNQVVMEARMWGKDVKGIDCGDEVAEWLTRVLFDAATRVRLLYKGGVMEHRAANPPQYFLFPQFQKTDRMYYADTCAYLVTTTSSLLDLNTRSKEPVQMTCFRPNLVVQSATPFDEDDWAFLKIGEVILRRLKPCERCIQTTINMNSGLRHPAGEPITTLKTYRVPKEPEKLAKLWKNKPTFGVNMAIESTGSLHTGDVVYVARISTHPWFRST